MAIAHFVRTPIGSRSTSSRPGGGWNSSPRIWGSVGAGCGAPRNRRSDGNYHVEPVMMQPVPGAVRSSRTRLP